MIERAKSQLAIQKSLEELDHQVSYVSDDAFDLKLDTIFDEYDDVSKLWWKMIVYLQKSKLKNQCFSNFNGILQMSKFKQLVLQR